MTNIQQHLFNQALADKPILIVDDTNDNNWFVWVKTQKDDGPTLGLFNSLPKAVQTAAHAGYPVGYWLMLSDMVTMNASSIKGSI